MRFGAGLVLLLFIVTFPAVGQNQSGCVQTYPVNTGSIGSLNLVPGSEYVAQFLSGAAGIWSNCGNVPELVPLSYG